MELRLRKIGMCVCGGGGSGYVKRFVASSMLVWDLDPLALRAKNTFGLIGPELPTVWLPSALAIIAVPMSVTGPTRSIPF